MICQNIYRLAAVPEGENGLAGFGECCFLPVTVSGGILMLLLCRIGMGVLFSAMGTESCKPEVLRQAATTRARVVERCRVPPFENIENFVDPELIS